MSIDLQRQLADYGRYLEQEQDAVVFDELVPADRVRPLPIPVPRRRWQAGLAVAVVVGVLVLVVVGVVPLLMSGNEQAPTVDDPPSTSVPVTEATVPTTLASLPPIPAGFDVIAEGVSPSSIGDVAWTVYEGAESAVEPSDALLEFGDELATTTPFSTDGDVVPNFWVDSIGTAEARQVAQWSVGIDWVATTLQVEGQDLADRSQDGRLLLPIPTNDDIVEILLFESEDDLHLFADKRGLPGEELPEPRQTVARFAAPVDIGREGWTVAVSDADTGDRVGKVSSTIPLAWPHDGRFRFGPIWVATSGEDVEQLYPEWDKGDLDNFDWLALDTPSGIFAYVGEGRSGEALDWEIWESVDGLRWTNIGSPNGWPPGYDLTSVEGSDGPYLAVITRTAGQNPGDEILLYSTDGIEWTRQQVPPQEFSGSSNTYENFNVYEVDAGWVWIIGIDTFSVQTSPDGETWQQVDLRGVPLPDTSGTYSMSGSAGNAIWFAQAAEGRPERLWLFEYP